MKTYNISFIRISKKFQDDLKNNILNNITFNKLSDDDLNKMYKQYNIDKNIILSYRNQLLKDYTVFNHYKITDNITKIIRDYNNNILKLSAKYKFSPMSIMRIIIKKKYPHLKLSKETLNNLDSEDKDQLLLAEKNDIVSNLFQYEQQKKADEYENDIAIFLNTNDVRYKTQEQLIEDQKKTKGYAYATPDFLLDEKIIINNHMIKWIEVKNFYGTNVRFIKKKIQKQIDKYHKIWGFGCLVFRYGIYENLKYENCITIAFDNTNLN
uniref:CDAN1-interacting nuclease 1 n=1 Tax=Megaviridae environmental sample TaxID=1737588 RepID=A0A5J6VKD1_9VIRU|nr:MAG: hypothetical protein [Megaviridae environmental sample]